MSELKIIIPCAGYGTRMGMLPHESKELLIAPGESGPIIDFTLEMAKSINASPIVISRKDKRDLNKYLKNKGIKPVLIEPQGEWMHTVLDSAPHWDDYNMLMLPDTRWVPPFTPLHNMVDSMLVHNASLALAIHEVDDPTKWCVRSADGKFMLEKPEWGGTRWAFGLIAWQKEYGKQFFRDLSDDKCAELPKNTEFTHLQDFQDITRGDVQLTKRK